MRNLYCSACSKLFKNVKSFENHENSKKHKENVARMTLDDDIDISDEDVEEGDEDIAEPVQVEDDKDTKVNGQTEEEGGMGNSTSDIEDNDVRETLSDDDTEHSDIQVYHYMKIKVLRISMKLTQNL